MDATGLVLQPNLALFVICQVLDDVGLGDNVFFSCHGGGEANSYFGFGDEFLEFFCFLVFGDSGLMVDDDLIEEDD